MTSNEACSITLLDASFAVYGDPITAFESLSFSDAWDEHGTFSIVLEPDVFEDAVGASWFLIKDRLYKNITAVSDDKSLTVKVTGATLNVLFDKIVIKETERLQGRLEERVRYLVNKYAITGSQAVSGLALGSDNNYKRAIDANTERGQSLSAFLYEQLSMRGYSYQITYDIDTGLLLFGIVRGEDRTQDQSVNPPVSLSTRDAIENASYKKSTQDYYNFAVVCDEDDTNPTTVEVDMSYGEPISAFYVSAPKAYRDPDAVENTFVMVGANGGIYTSVNGIAFTARASGTSEDLWSVDYQNGRFIVGIGNGNVLVSSNATSWSVKTTGAPSGYAIEGVMYIDGMYAAFTSGGGIGYSYDSDVWTGTGFAAYGKIVNAISAKGKLIAVAAATTITMCSSESGAAWIATPVEAPFGATLLQMLRTCYLGGVLTSAGYWYNGTTYKPLVTISRDDGLSGEAFVVEPLSGHQFLDMAAGLGLLVAVGQPDIIAWSDDHGVTWTECTPTTAIDYICIAFDGTTFYAYGNTTRKVATSTDGKNWTVQNITGVTQNPDAIVFCASSYIDSLRQIGVAEIMKRGIVESIDGDINSELAPVYETDYNVGDMVDVIDERRGIRAVKRVLSVEHLIDKTTDYAITPKLGKDFLSLRQYIAKELKR